MSEHTRTTAAGLLLIAALALVPAARGQEEAPLETSGSRFGNVYIDLETWVAQPVGLEYYPATFIDLDNPRATTLFEIPHSTEGQERYGLAYALPSEWGTISYTLYKHETNRGLSRLTPGIFTFGELATHPQFAGVYNDGIADGFAAVAETTLRDWRLDFRRAAFRSPRVSADWFVGWRRTRHKREMSTEYYALVPDIPPLLPPNGYCPDPCPLIPQPDTALQFSQYEGRGVTVGMDLEFPMWKNKVVFEADAAISVMRGKIKTSYGADNRVYVEDSPETPGPILLGPPYDRFDDLIIIDPGQPAVPRVNFITQQTFSIGLVDEGASTDSQVLEASAGFRWRTPLKWLEVYGGFRQTHYADVGLELRPKNVTFTVTQDGVILRNFEELTETSRSATYEGFYGGVRVRVY
jgi:hypothetical protein